MPMSQIIQYFAGIVCTVIQLGFWSDARKFNPFQELLYSQQETMDYSADPIVNPFKIDSDPDVVHLHWIEGLKYFYGRSPLQVEFFIWLGIHQLFKQIGPDRLSVCTIHNFNIHDDDGYKSQNRRFMKRIIRKFDLVHFLSKESQSEFSNYLGIELDPKKILVGQHPTYASVYRRLDSDYNVRENLLIPENGIVIGYVGSLRPYKNLNMLLEAYVSLTELNQNVFLLIAGSDGDRNLSNKISVLQKCDSRIMYRPEHIPDEMILNYLETLDLAVFPFDDPDEILNSGSIILALSYCIQSIIPDFKSLSEIKKLSIVKTFQAGNTASLMESIQNEIDLIPERKGNSFNVIPPDMEFWLAESAPEKVSQAFFQQVTAALHQKTQRKD
jgi:glycosyltransferase involved in cell wall biosynthesis